MSTLDEELEQFLEEQEEEEEEYGKRPAIRKVVEWIPLLKRVKKGEGARFEIKFDITPDAVTLTGQDEYHHQGKGAREYFDRRVEENPAALCHFLCEVVMRALREVPRRESR